MKVVVINSGSSSIKFQLLEMDKEEVLATGLVERIGSSEAQVRCTYRPGEQTEEKHIQSINCPDHRHGMRLAVQLLVGPGRPVADPGAIAAVGHRIVHGGEEFHQPTLISDEVLAAIEKNIPLAPLHNPANLDGVRIARELFAEVPQVAVFDTAFHQTIPPEAYHYALPAHLYRQWRVRRYGFHGTSHKFVAGECARAMQRPLEELNLITLHLGNGCSMTAIEKGRSVDTSLGLTPLEGLVMGSRSGDVDPAMHAFLARNCGMDIESIDHLLNNESGLKGLCGMNDMRDIHAAIAAGDTWAELALAVQTYRNRKYIGAYLAVLGRVDAVVFTAGIGENDPVVRARTLAGLEPLGIAIDTERNHCRSAGPRRISSDDSRVAVWVVPTNEELAIAREVRALLTPA